MEQNNLQKLENRIAALELVSAQQFKGIKEVLTELTDISSSQEERIMILVELLSKLLENKETE